MTSVSMRLCCENTRSAHNPSLHTIDSTLHRGRLHTHTLDLDGTYKINKRPTLRYLYKFMIAMRTIFMNLAIEKVHNHSKFYHSAQNQKLCSLCHTIRLELLRLKYYRFFVHSCDVRT